MPAIREVKKSILNLLFLLAAASLFLFYKNMFYLYIITISLMILMFIKSYRQGIKNGLAWLGIIMFVMIISMLRYGLLNLNDFSEILLVLAPSIIVGLLAEKQRKYVSQLKETYVSTLKALAEATDARDSYTQGHSERVAKYSVSIAKELLLPENEINVLEQAALLHDIGKIAVPDQILNKTEPFNENDWQIMKKYPEHSQRIIANLSFLSEVIPTVLYHHKRFDKRGYPVEEPETKIPLAAQILSVADALDAMTSDRPYRGRLSLEQAFEELEKGSGSQFDPKVVRAFKKAKGSTETSG